MSFTYDFEFAVKCSIIHFFSLKFGNKFIIYPHPKESFCDLTELGIQLPKNKFTNKGNICEINHNSTHVDCIFLAPSYGLVTLFQPILSHEIRANAWKVSYQPNFVDILGNIFRNRNKYLELEIGIRKHIVPKTIAFFIEWAFSVSIKNVFQIFLNNLKMFFNKGTEWVTYILIWDIKLKRKKTGKNEKYAKHYKGAYLLFNLSFTLRLFIISISLLVAENNLKMTDIFPVEKSTDLYRLWIYLICTKKFDNTHGKRWRHRQR